MLFIFLNKEFLLAIQEFILLMNNTYQFIQFLFLLHVKVGKKGKQIILIFTSATIITRCCIFGGGSRFYLLAFAVLCHEALVADVGEEDTLVDDDVGGTTSLSEEESVELTSESHSRHTWASRPSSCSTSSFPSSFPSCRRPYHCH